MRRLIPYILILVLFCNVVHGAFGGFLQANTAVDVMVGPFIDDGDGKTTETGLTITQAEVRLSKNGGNMAQKNEATSLTHDELGKYVCKLDTTDTNTEGILTITVIESGALAVDIDYQVLAQAAYISFMTAKDTGFMGVDTVAVSTDTTAADNLELFTEVLENGTGLIDAGTFKAGAIDAAAIAAAAIDNATFAADVGSTAYATNIIALAVRKTIDEVQLDHLLGVTTTVAADGDLSTYCVDGSIGSHLLTAGADTSDYKASTDSQEALLTVPFVDIGAGAPSATPSWFTGLNRLYMAWLDKTVTNGTTSEIEYYNFAGTKIAEAPISDDGTDFTRDKIAAID